MSAASAADKWGACLPQGLIRGLPLTARAGASGLDDGFMLRRPGAWETPEASMLRFIRLRNVSGRFPALLALRAPYPQLAPAANRITIAIISARPLPHHSPWPPLPAPSPESQGSVFSGLTLLICPLFGALFTDSFHGCHAARGCHDVHGQGTGNHTTAWPNPVLCKRTRPVETL